MTECVGNGTDWEIWCGDAADMDWPVDIDLLIADPPYGKKFRSNRGGKGSGAEIVGDDDQSKIDLILRQVWRRIRPHRHAYIFGPQRVLPGAKPQDLIWDKVYMSGGDTRAVWGNAHENLTWYTHEYRSEMTKLRRSSILRVPAARGSARKGGHPNEKPVVLMQQLIEASSLYGDLVVDPFCGTGSVGVACRRLGRRYIGVELDEGFAQQAIQRLERMH